MNELDLIDEVYSLIEGKTKDELYSINKIIVSEIRRRNTVDGIRESAKYEPGDPVSFVTRNGIEKFGRVVRVNKKTLTIAVKGSVREEKWRVAYSFVTKES